MDLLGISSIFNSEGAVKSLLHCGDLFGITIVDDKGQPIIGNVIDVGLIERESLNYNIDIPFGYETYIDSSLRRTIICPCTLQYSDSRNSTLKQNNMTPKETYSLIKCEYYPSNSRSDPSKPICDAQFNNRGDELNSNLLTLIPGSMERFNIVISVDDRFQGSIARWVLLTLQGNHFPTPTCVTQTTFVMGIQIRGSVISAASRRLLSSEAPAFVPTYLSTYFDSMVPVSNTLHLPEPLKKQLSFSPPTIFQAIITSMKDYGVPAPFLIQSYIDCVASKSLPSFIKLYLHLSNTPPGPMKAAVDHINTLQALNCAEELQMTRDIVQYDLHYQKIWFMPLDHNMRGLNDGVVKARFTVIGLSESRPKITIGDIIRIRPAEEDIIALCKSDHISRHLSELQGIVTSCSLKTEEVECQFLISRQILRDHSGDSPNLPMNVVIMECNKIRYHMRFTFKREGFAFISEALNTIAQDESFVAILNPELDAEVKTLRFDFDPNSIINKSDLKAELDTGFEWNAEQLFAIEAISSHLWRAIAYLSNVQIPKKAYSSGRGVDIKRRQRLPPFIIHGPPGTGKTSTVIEAIRKLKEIHPTKRILICAPSDAAADVVCARLRKYFTNKQMLRLNWWQRLPDSIQPPDLITYCLTDTRGLFDMPATAARMSATKQKLLSYDIVVTTCVCAGALRHHNDATGTLLFDVVVVDEVSQATEGEALVPLSMCSPAGMMIIAGDPKQLGAEMRSSLYKLSDYKQSLQERLMSYSLYSKCLPLNISSDAQGNFISPRTTLPNDTPRDGYGSVITTPRESMSIISPREQHFFGNNSSTSINSTAFDMLSLPIRDLHIGSSIGVRDANMSPMTSPREQAMISPRDQAMLSSRDQAIISPRDTIISGVTSRHSDASNLRGLLSLTHSTHNMKELVTPRTPSSGSNSAYSSNRSILNMDFPNLNLDHINHDVVDLSTPRTYDLTSSLGVFLKKNYRSHHHMLHVPSKLFYHNAMETYTSNPRVSQYLNWSWLPSQGSFPMLFVGVDGQHYHAIDSPSFYNLHEAIRVVDVIKSLLSESELGITTRSIGVIGGFRSQVLKIRQLLRAENLSSINVGGVEDYQGQEKDVIIISTVMTSRVSTYERNGALGLIGDDRRFNVALTRGVGLCIVIGHPIHLYSDRNWREFMEYCDEYSCCVGAPCPLLLRLVNERTDDDDLLNIAAQTALGGGYDDEAMVDMSYNYSNGRDSYWRVNL